MAWRCCCCRCVDGEKMLRSACAMVGTSWLGRERRQGFHLRARHVCKLVASCIAPRSRRSGLVHGWSPAASAAYVQHSLETLLWAAGAAAAVQPCRSALLARQLLLKLLLQQC